MSNSKHKRRDARVVNALLPLFALKQTKNTRKEEDEATRRDEIV